MILISLHLPKTAGTSFGKSLEDFFDDTLLRDYGSRSISKPKYESRSEALRSSIEIANQGLDNINCVHGHFLPIKYLLLGTVKQLTFITWMRDPVQRMISHYNYWQKAYNPERSTPLHKQVIEEKWTLEEFCLHPKFRNIYCQYLWGFPLEYFDFIGITEYYHDDLLYFAEKYLSKPLNHKRLNSNSQTTEYSVKPALRERIERYHAQDIILYQRAVELRLQRRLRKKTIAHR